MLRAVPAIMLIAALDGSCIQVRHLHLSDLTDLVFGDGSNFSLVGNSGTGFQVAGFLQQNCCRRGLGDEAEASVRIYSDDNGDDQIALVSGSCIELFCKLNDIYTMLTQCRTYWRSRGSLCQPGSVI